MPPFHLQGMAQGWYPGNGPPIGAHPSSNLSPTLTAREQQRKQQDEQAAADLDDVTDVLRQVCGDPVLASRNLSIAC